MSASPEPQSVQDATEGSGRGETTWAEVEALAALLEPEAFDPDQPADETWRKSRKAVASAHAARVLAAGYVRAEQPELITTPTFQGCTHPSADFCACGDDLLCCAACGQEIDEGTQAYMAQFPYYQWMPADAPGQELETQYWHTYCDLRGSVSGGGQGV